MGLSVPEEYGGFYRGHIYVCLAVEEIARACVSSSLIVQVQSLGWETILIGGNEAQKKKYGPAIASGEKLVAFGLTEPGAGSDAAAMKTKAVKKGDRYILNGSKCFISNGPIADVISVFAMTDSSKGVKGISAFIVEKGTEGFQVGREEDKMGLRASDTTDLIFDNCRVPIENMLGKEGDGFKIAMTGLDGGRIGIAAQAIGVAQAALDIAVAYAKEREQFGEKISKFQGLRWIIADMATEIEASRQLMFSAAAMKDRGENFTAQASMAKLFASEMVNRITAQALQIHGGYGVTKEYAIERMYRDCRVFTIYEGTSEIQRIVISNSIINDR